MRCVAYAVLLCLVLALLLLASGLFGLAGYRWSQRRNQLTHRTSETFTTSLTPAGVSSLEKVAVPHPDDTVAPSS